MRRFSVPSKFLARTTHLLPTAHASTFPPPARPVRQTARHALPPFRPAATFARVMLDPRYLSGQLLLALPGIGDPRFERAVIAMCVHDEHGALGLMISGLHEGLMVRQLMEQLDIDPGVTPQDAPIYVGGPVEPGRGFVLHSQDYDGDGTLIVADMWSLSASQQVLKDIAAGRGPRRWLMALGYSGWGEGQLDDEMRGHGWMSLDAGGLDDLIYDAQPETRWTRAFQQLGVDVAHLATAAGNA